MPRLLIPGGTVHIKVPHWSRGFTHWDHKRGFDESFSWYFRPGMSGGFAELQFECVKVRLTWSAFPHYKRQIANPLLVSMQEFVGLFIDFFANLSPMVASRIWCFYVGGFEEISFLLRKSTSDSKSNV